MRRFLDRAQAGRELASALDPYRVEQPIVLALPRGGLPVAYEVAMRFEAPLEVLVTRKVGIPWEPETAMGAVSEGGGVFLHPHRWELADITDRDLNAAVDREALELRRRAGVYRGKRPVVAVAGRTVILVDDGLESGSSLLAAADAVRRMEARKVVAAVPVATQEGLAAVRPLVDDLVVLTSPEELLSLQECYELFPRLDDLEVIMLLDRAAHLQEKTSR